VEVKEWVTPATFIKVSGALKMQERKTRDWKRGIILQGWKMQDWKTWDRFAGGGKRKTGKRGNDKTTCIMES